MFALFFNLYLAMFLGSWHAFNYDDIGFGMKSITNSLGELLTSIFNNVNTPMTTLGDSLFGSLNIGGVYINASLYLVSFVLALITSIGIVVMAVKGVKKAFGIFFMGIRRL